MRVGWRPVSMIVGFALDLMVVPVVVIDVAVRVPVHDPVGVGMRMRVRIAGGTGI